MHESRDDKIITHHEHYLFLLRKNEKNLCNIMRVNAHIRIRYKIFLII